MKALSLMPTKIPYFLKYIKRRLWMTSLTKKVSVSSYLEGGTYPKIGLLAESSTQKIEVVSINYHSMSELSEKTKVSNVCFSSV